MKLFNTLCLEINSSCNRRCRFCPVAYYKRPDELMQYKLVLKVANELGATGYKGRVEFYVYNEPLLRLRYLVQCIELFRRLVPRSTLMIATNGDYLKGTETIRTLRAAGLNQLLINCYSHNRLSFLRSISASFSNAHGSAVYAVGKHRQFHLRIEDKSDARKFGTGIFRLVNRAGNVSKFLPPQKSHVDRMCVKPFRLLNINWRGEALICCMDYHADVPVGSLASDTMVEIWNSPTLNFYRQRLLSKRRDQPLCRLCDCYAGAYAFNVCTDIGPSTSGETIEEKYLARLRLRSQQ